MKYFLGTVDGAWEGPGGGDKEEGKIEQKGQVDYLNTPMGQRPGEFYSILQLRTILS